MNLCIVIPVFNHAASVRGVVEGVRAAVPACPALIVVDDGSTDGGGALCAGLEGVTVLRHARNRGKGAALLTGFRHARQAGYTHAVTVDADGQHRAADVAKLIEAATAEEEAAAGRSLWIGCRDMDAAAARGIPVPARSRKGRDAARFWLKVQTGQDIPDSQCGLRVYQIAQVLGLRFWFSRYDFETEVLARLAWGGVRVRGVAIECVYFPAEARVSHFRPVWDTLRGVRVNVLLVARRLAPWPVRRVAPRDGAVLALDGGGFGAWWKAATWKRAVAEALREGSGNTEIAASFALGIFVGLTPFYMLQTLIAVYLARRLHLNPLPAILGSQISIPPLVPVWVLLMYGVGHLLMKEEGRAITALVVGDLAVAGGMAVLGLIVARGVLGVARPE